MQHTPENTGGDEPLPLTKEHPAYIKLAEKLSELESDEVDPNSEEYSTEVEKFVRAEPALAAHLSHENRYLQTIMARMNGEEGIPATDMESESEPSIEAVHRQAFATAQEMSGWCNKLAIELKSRADRRLTPLFDENNLRALYHSAQPFEDALASNQTDNAVESIRGLVRALSGIEKVYTLGVSEDVESLKKFGFYITQFGELSAKLARLYGEVDTTEALEITHSSLRLKEVTEEKLQLLAQMIRVLSNYK